MTGKHGKIIELRALLHERFPEAPSTRTAAAVPLFSTGLPELDAPLGGGLVRGALTEIVRPDRGLGAASLIAALVAATAAAEAGHNVALVDGTDCFDATALGDAALARLLWVRCHGDTNRLLRATELLCRDGNLPLVIADAADLPITALRQFGPAPMWYRLSRVLEGTATVCLVVSPQTLAGAAARTRLRLGPAGYGFDALDAETEELIPTLELTLERQRHVPVAPEEEDNGKIVRIA